MLCALLLAPLGYTLVPPPLPCAACAALGPPARPSARAAAPRRAGGVRLGNAEFEFAFDDEEDEEDDEEDNAALIESRELRADLIIFDKPAENMTVAELKEQLKRVGARSTGTKAELIKGVQLIQRKDALGLPLNDLEVMAEEDLHWYMVQTANGFERTVEKTLNIMIKKQGFQKKIPQVFVPILEGGTSIRESSVMPSYIFLRMRMEKNLHQLISNMQYVIAFVGFDRGGRSRGGQMVGNRGFVRPIPMTDEQFEHVVSLTRAKVFEKEEAEAAEEEAAFAIDDMVEVLEGPFKGMQGPVLELAAEEEALTLVLSVMGRDTPVQLPQRQCEKLPDLSEA